ncbi:hypothetical protein L0A91_05295 [Ornithinimicrobium sp. INDO-MA30-4]|nr:hypothetical protein L0A91_05295 [Ornithinimicrobium sp. INDO-MA30-4]
MPRCSDFGEEAHSANSAIMVEYRQAKHAFTVDPVDGTKNFVRGSKDHAVMVGEVVDGETTGPGSGSHNSSWPTSPSVARSDPQWRAVAPRPRDESPG